MPTSLHTYAALASSRHRGVRPSYRTKLVTAAALGAAVPVACVGAALAVRAGTGAIAAAAVAGGLAGAAGAGWLVNELLAPVTRTAAALRGYLTRHVRPDLPRTHADVDEAGGLMADVQYTVERLDAMAVHAATHDRATGLPNRTWFREQLRQAVALRARDGRPVGVLALDLDDFETANLALGRGGGDVLLAAVAQRLQGLVRDVDLIARLDGGEFGVLCAGAATGEGLDVLARRIVDGLRRPFVVHGREVTIGASVGISVTPTDPGGADDLLAHAIAARGEVQRVGGNAHRFYSADLDARLRQRLAIEADLRHALARGELFLQYQPKIDVATGRVRGFEALLRWQHPERGLVSPAEFVPIAEATGLIVPIGEWVLRTACADIAAWRARGLPAPAVAVNLSARQFRQAGLVAIVRAALADHAIDPALLELEVTESLLMDDTAHTIGMLCALRAEGVQISLDDFGTGYSSLSYLKRFPIDCIKLDKSFVRDVASDRQSGAISEAIIALGHSLGLVVVAEGVETPEQLAYLTERACDVVQGFLFGKPMAPDAVAALLDAEAGLPRPWLRGHTARAA